MQAGVKEKFWQLYERAALGKPVVVLVALAALIAWLATYAGEFKLDASADALVLENDDDLKFYRSVAHRYGSDDFLAVTYTPQGQLFTPGTLGKLRALKDELEALPGITQVLSILNVPLLNSPRVSLTELSRGARTLETPGVDLQLAEREFRESPLYRELLLSKDGKTTMMLAYLESDARYNSLLDERERLRAIKHQGQLDAGAAAQLEKASREFKAYQAVHTQRGRELIARVRSVIDRHRTGAEMFLGGVPMIIADMIAMIENDLAVFSGVVVLFLVLMLAVIFRSPRWVVLPMLCCSLSALAMVGLLGLLNWRVTVVSSNFVALLLIIAMSMTIHLTVRFRELQAQNPDAPTRRVLSETIRFMLKPCAYTSLTTIVAFASLLVSGIRPIIDFGYIMTIGIVFAFLLIFTLFPGFLMVLKKGRSSIENDFTSKLTHFFAQLAQRRCRAIVAIALGLMAASALGILQLTVENRFIDYFRDNTEIHRGMLVIDRKLGGTTPLDIVFRAEESGDASADAAAAPEDPLEDDLLGDYFSGEDEQPAGNYWLNPRKFQEIKRLHDYFEAQPEIGKVMSLATLIEVAEMLNDGQPLGDLEVALLGKLLPDAIKNVLYKPYISDDGNELRFNMRIVDSDKNLQRRELIARAQADVEDLGYSGERFRLTGMLVLYNNMLQSLYESQILTIGMVFLAIMLMFVVLFRSPALAAIAIFPNMLAAAMVLGLMGWWGLPLDLMTITIAAISVGIAVDNTIHYIIRFKREFPKDRDYHAAVERCHGSIGKAMYYTSVTIIFGFSILSLSNFIPTIYFGFLTGFAMFAALLASLTLLPSLLILFKPLGPAGGASAGAAPQTASQ